MKRLLRQIVRLSLVVALACLECVGVVTAADDAGAVRHNLNIPRQKLDVALEDLARQTGLQIVRFSDAVKADIIVGPLNGAYSIEQALRALLEPSGLTYRSLNPRAYMVVPQQDASDGTGAAMPAPKQTATAQEIAHAARTLNLERTDENANVGISLEEITVTAQKIEERLRDVPMSITALTVRDMRALGATLFLDFANVVPSLSFTSSGVGQTQVSLRGVTTGYNVSSTVGVYVDDVPYGSSTPFVNGAQLALDVGLYDMNRIEILRGPQGTLYGASTMGGLLKYVTNAPDASSFRGVVRANVSGTEEGGVGYDASSAVNMPLLAGEAALRMGGFYQRNGGYVDNLTLVDHDVDEADVYGGRVDFLYAPSQRFSVRLSAHAQDIGREGSIAADFDRASGEPSDRDLDQRRALAEPFDQRFRLASATVTYAFDSATLTSISSYQTARSEAITDFSALYVPQFGGPGAFSGIGLTRNTDTDKATQELRLAHSGPRVDWLLGGFYTNEDSEHFQQLLAYDPGGALAPVNLLTATIPSRFEEYAGFANVTLHITDKLDITGGARHARNSQRQEQIASGELIEPSEARGSSDSVTTYLANIRHRTSDHVMPYLRVATGYRPGGPNLVVTDTRGEPRGLTAFDADRLVSYEAGVKFGSVDRRFNADLSAYYIDWNDTQVVAIRNGLGVIANAAQARSRGAELSIAAAPGADFTIAGAFGYTSAELTADAPDLGGVSGESLPDTPEVTAAVSAEYRFPLGSYEASAGATLRYAADRNASFDQSAGMPQYRLREYTTVDLRGGVTLGGARLQLYCRNVGDERGQLSALTGTSLSGGPANVSILQPRTVGLSVEMNF